MDRPADDASSDVAVADSRGDTLYRRPPAHPPAESTTGGSWFTEGTEIPDPFSAPVPPSSAVNSRASFGFSDDPISPVRHGPTSAPPFSSSGQTFAPPAQTFASPAQTFASPAPAPVSPSWPPSPRLDPEPLERVSGALRSPSGEHAARRAPASLPPVSLPPEPRQSRIVTMGIVVLSAIVLVLGSIAGVMYFTGSDTSLPLGNGNATAGRTVSAPLDNRTKASFELLAGVNSVRVTIGELGDDLYRISTPDDAGILPDPTIRNDDVKLQVSKDGDGTGGEIEVVLAAKVRWQLRFSGYAQKQVIDVSGGQVSGIEMVAAMKQAEVTLSRPSGTVPLKINGAVDKLVLKSPADNPVRIKVGGGAQSVVAGTKTLKDLAAGSTLTPKGWATTDRYDVTAGARINALTIENA
ncbi:hypothetical protein ACIA5D_13990 [Actinoplanes sp. NPDC051513]|uniref:hypothetical protein n=1 Tax=Actinoplanes sp. NPDC051513 TaxID=3363908 RepID=UPI0037B885F8